MRGRRDNFDDFCSILGGAIDALTTFGAFMLSYWIRFHSGLIPLHRNSEAPLIMYLAAGLVLSILLVIIFRLVGLYIRPQLGSFGDRFPKIVRGTSITVATALAFSFVVRDIPGWPPYSRTVALISFFIILVLITLERFILFRAERHWAKRKAPIRRILIIGVNEAAARVRRVFENEPRLRARLGGYLLPTDEDIPDMPLDPAITPDLVKGHIGDLETVATLEHIDEVILADPSVTRERLSAILLHCEQHLIPFCMVPDLYGILTSRMRIEHVADIPLLGMLPWPLEAFWNRFLKRAEDIAGSLVGLIFSAPVILAAIPFIKRSSPGPVFYKQERCGYGGKAFTIYKLRTMPVDAEAGTGPVWTTPDDARRTSTGEFLRRWNLDELPQFWNVLKGDMSLVGPRPERPYFVEQFKKDIGNYMTRHVSRPGMTGLAQVNGLRGNTSIADRIRHDLFYLENWSLSLDLKILIRTFINRENAY